MNSEKNRTQGNIEEQERWATEALKSVSDEKLFAAPKLSDAAFLVSVRNRISARTSAVYTRLAPSFRTVAAVASVCVILLVAIVSVPQFTPTPAVQNGLSEIATMPTEAVVDSLAEAQIDPVELAVYLDVPEYAEEDVEDAKEDMPLTDQLMTLDDGTLEEVLASLEDTRFF